MCLLLRTTYLSEDELSFYSAEFPDIVPEKKRYESKLDVLREDDQRRMYQLNEQIRYRCEDQL